MNRIALWLALAALAVNAPRFVILFLKVDGIYLPRELEGFLLAITGIATGVVLSGGGAYIAHVLAHPTPGGNVRAFLTTSWIMLLVFNVILLAPMMVVAVRVSELAIVLDTPSMQWVWSIVAIVAVEWLAGSAMAAFVLLDHNRPSDPLSGLMERLSNAVPMPFASKNETAQTEWNGNMTSGSQYTLQEDQPHGTRSKGLRP